MAASTTLRPDLKPHRTDDNQPCFSAAAHNRFAKTRAKILEHKLKRDIPLYLSRSAREPFFLHNRTTTARIVTGSQGVSPKNIFCIMLCTSSRTSGAACRIMSTLTSSSPTALIFILLISVAHSWSVIGSSNSCRIGPLSMLATALSTFTSFASPPMLSMWFLACSGVEYCLPSAVEPVIPAAKLGKPSVKSTPARTLQRRL